MVLKLERSRILWVWWLLLHALLGVAFALVGWAAPFRFAAVAVVLGHCVMRRPAESPGTVVMAEGGRCAVPEWNTGLRALGPRTLVARFWIRLDLGRGPWRRDILLFADQVRPETWRRLRALLLRARCE